MEPAHIASYCKSSHTHPAIRTVCRWRSATPWTVPPRLDSAMRRKDRLRWATSWERGRRSSDHNWSFTRLRPYEVLAPLGAGDMAEFCVLRIGRDEAIDALRC